MARRHKLGSPRGRGHRRFRRHCGLDAVRRMPHSRKMNQSLVPGFWWRMVASAFEMAGVGLVERWSSFCSPTWKMCRSMKSRGTNI